jgi:hypothetical protein
MIAFTNLSIHPDQVLKPGTRVYIKKDLGSMMNHFPKDQFAIVSHSYYQIYPNRHFTNPEYGLNTYALILDDGNTSAWYELDNLTWDTL